MVKVLNNDSSHDTMRGVARALGTMSGGAVPGFLGLSYTGVLIGSNVSIRQPSPRSGVSNHLSFTGKAMIKSTGSQSVIMHYLQ